jgi:hypothetical protein
MCLYCASDLCREAEHDGEEGRQAETAVHVKTKNDDGGVRRADWKV